MGTKSRRNLWFWLVIVWILPISILIVVDYGRGWMVSESQADKALEAAGFTKEKLLNRSNWNVNWDGCRGDDAAAFTYKAKNPKGRSVKVLVCIGWPFKGSSIIIPD